MVLGISFYPEQCLKNIHRSSKCSLCVDVCPTQAIDFKTISPRLDSLKCVSCGACVALCPTDVFEAKRVSDEEIIGFIEAQKKENTEEIVFACEHTQTKETHLKIPCLARLDASLLFSCLTHTSASVKLIHGQCEKCHASSFKTVFEETLRRVKNTQPNAKIELLDLDEYVAKKDEKIEGITKDGHLRRRMLFSLFGRKPASKKSEILAVQSPILFKDNRYKQRSFKKHDRFRRFLTLMQDDLSLDSIIGIKPTIDPLKCHECTLCTKVCPTGALGMNDTKAFCIDYTSKECITCHMCEDICFAKAIRFVPKSIEDMLINTPTKLIEKEELYQKEEEKKVIIFRT